MANYNQLKTRAQQVRDEQTIGGNTALRVGQLLMDMVDAESETVDNIVELFTGTEDNPVIPTLPNPGLLHWLQSPIVALVSMGEDLDGDAGAVVQEGDLYYYNHNGYQIFVKGAGGSPGTGYKAHQKVLYLNKYTGKLYEWTGADMSEIVLAGTGGGGGNVTIEEGQYYIDITIDDNVPVIDVSTQSIVMSGQTKTATFTVSGHNLTAPIRINGGNAYFSKSPSSISPVGGIVEATTVTVTFGGDSDDTDDLIVSSIGAASKTIHVTYTAVAGPTILVNNTLTIKAAAGQSNTGQLAVTGLNLTAGITASVSGTGFTVSNTENGTYGSSASLPSSGGTLYVKFSPTGSTGSTGTLTLESTGATNKMVDLTGAVVGTLSISPASASISFVSGKTGTGTFHVNGENLTPSTTATVTVSGGGTADKQTLTVDANGEIDEDVAVTTNTSGTLTVSHTDADDNATASFTAVEVQPLPVGYYFDINNLRYTVLSGQTTVSVKQVDTTATTSANIPSTVNDDGLTATDGTNTATGSGMNYTVVALANDAFKYNVKITSVTIPNTVTSIGSHAFDTCGKLTSLTIPNSVTSIGEYALWALRVSSITIGDGLASLDGQQFNASNYALDTFDLGTSLSAITGSNTQKLKDGANVYLRYNGVVQLTKGSGFFYTTSASQPTNAILHVPSSQVDAYKASSTWTAQFQTANIVAI